MSDWNDPHVRHIYSPEDSDTKPTFMQRIRRLRCYRRGYHVSGPLGQAKFRFDVAGYCHDCGKVEGKKLWA